MNVPAKTKNSWLHSSRDSLDSSASNSAGSTLGKDNEVNAQTATITT